MLTTDLRPWTLDSPDPSRRGKAKGKISVNNRAKIVYKSSTMLEVDDKTVFLCNYFTVTLRYTFEIIFCFDCKAAFLSVNSKTACNYQDRENIFHRY